MLEGRKEDRTRRPDMRRDGVSRSKHSCTCVRVQAEGQRAKAAEGTDLAACTVDAQFGGLAAIHHPHVIAGRVGVNRGRGCAASWKQATQHGNTGDPLKR